MTVYIEARTEPFVDQRRRLAANYRARFRAEANIRRPLRGYQLKQDTYAVIRVMGSDGQFIPVIDAAGEEVLVQDGQAYTTYWSNFFIQTVTEQRHEKQQIVDTFGESYIFFFGEAPRMLTVGGFLLNTADFNWRAEFWENYENYFRGTRLVEQGARLYLIYDDIIVEGYMTTANAVERSQPVAPLIQFNFSMFVTGYTNISGIGNPQFPMARNVYTGLSPYERGIRDWQLARQQELSHEQIAAADRAAGRRGFQPNPFGSGASSDSELDFSRTNEIDYGTTSGSGTLLSDSLRTRVVDAGDPSTSSFLARAAEAIGNTPEGFRRDPYNLRTRISENVDEFVQRALAMEDIPWADSPFEDDSEQWARADQSIDDAVSAETTEDETGASPDTTDSDYADTMGRPGRAQDEIEERGGRRREGSGIRRQFGGSDVEDSSDRSGFRRGPRVAESRRRPYGMTRQFGELL